MRLLPSFLQTFLLGELCPKRLHTTARQSEILCYFLALRLPAFGVNRASDVADPA